MSEEGKVEEIWNKNLCVGTLESCCEFHLKKSDVQRILKDFSEALRQARKEGEESLRTQLGAYKAEIDFLKDKYKVSSYENVIDYLQEESTNLKSLIKKVSDIVCSFKCESVWATAEGQKHCDLCKEISEALRKGVE